MTTKFNTDLMKFYSLHCPTYISRPAKIISRALIFAASVTALFGSAVLTCAETCQRTFKANKTRISHLFVLYDAGETQNMIPVMKKLEEQGTNFRVLVMATSETLVKPDMFKNKRITLLDLNIKDKIERDTPRTTPLSKTALTQLSRSLDPKIVVVGTASRIQQQAIEIFRKAKTVAFADNFNYDLSTESFKTANAVQAVAKKVLCPSITTVEQLSNASNQPSSKYVVVGKPILNEWEKEIAEADTEAALKALNLQDQKGPIITFIGGYGSGYEVINPLFKSYAEKLRHDGFRVVIQPHPKVETQLVKTTALLALSKQTQGVVIGYNSSVPFDARLIGIDAIYMIPESVPFSHFAVEKGLAPLVRDYEDLLNYLKNREEVVPLRDELGIPLDSVSEILHAIE